MPLATPPGWRAIAVGAQRLVEQRLLLEEDADRYVALAM